MDVTLTGDLTARTRKEISTMKTSGVICEFNPFHNGHAYLLSRMREQVGEDGCVICVMSGRFVQRGEASVADPYLRAGSALEGGADLVLELPFPWSCASAEHFALAGARILSLLGVDTLTFGSETGDPHLLHVAESALNSPTFGAAYAELCRGGIGTAAAFTRALRAASPIPLPDGFPASNDLLGIAYVRALHLLRTEGWHAPASEIVLRLGAAYRDDTLTDTAYPSATALRVLIREAACDPVALEAILTDTMPAGSLARLMEGLSAGDMPIEGDRLLPFLHAYYRLADPASLEGFAECGGGIMGHICRVARETPAASGFMEALRTKQYTDARLRRALLFGALGVEGDDLLMKPCYTTMLGANERGRAFLRKWRKERGGELWPRPFEVVTKPADAPHCCQRALGERADALFTLCYPAPRGAGDLCRRTPYVGS